MGIDVEIWVNKKEVLDKIKKLEFWELMFHLESLNGIRYYKLQDILGEGIKNTIYSTKDLNKWVLKWGLEFLNRKHNFMVKDLLYLFESLNEVILVPDNRVGERDGLISVSNLIEEFEIKIEL